MMKLTIVASALLLTIGLTLSASSTAPVVAQPAETAKPAAGGRADEAGGRAADNAIRRVLNDQVAAWNSGDIPGFMAGYLKSESLRFASGDSITYGWQPTLDRYQKRYTDRDIMGQLEFRDLKILLLGNHYAEVFGSWHLTRKDAVGNASGLFTLLMQQTENGWKVIHDHTSSAPATSPTPSTDGDGDGEDHGAADADAAAYTTKDRTTGAKKQPQ